MRKRKKGEVGSIRLNQEAVRIKKKKKKTTDY